MAMPRAVKRAAPQVHGRADGLDADPAVLDLDTLGAIDDGDVVARRPSVSTAGSPNAS